MRLAMAVSCLVLAPLGEAASAPIERRVMEDARRAGGPTVLAATTARVEQRAQRPAWLEQERVGPPYEAAGRWYVPTPEPGYEERGASVRYVKRDGVTASGDVYDPRALTAAHPTLPIPSLVQVTDLASGREVIVRVNDRGPFTPGALIALSDGAADALGVLRQSEVHVRYLGPAPRRVAAPAQAAQRMPASQRGAYVVKAGVFRAEANARRAQATLSRVGAVAVEPGGLAGAQIWRVSVGPLSSREEAESARRAAAALGFPDAHVAES